MLRVREPLFPDLIVGLERLTEGDGVGALLRPLADQVSTSLAARRISSARSRALSIVTRGRAPRPRLRRSPLMVTRRTQQRAPGVPSSAAQRSDRLICSGWQRPELSSLDRRRNRRLTARSRPAPLCPVPTTGWDLIVLFRDVDQEVLARREPNEPPAANAGCPA